MSVPFCFNQMYTSCKPTFAFENCVLNCKLYMPAVSTVILEEVINTSFAKSVVLSVINVAVFAVVIWSWLLENAPYGTDRVFNWLRMASTLLKYRRSTLFSWSAYCRSYCIGDSGKLGEATWLISKSEITIMSYLFCRLAWCQYGGFPTATHIQAG